MKPRFRNADRMETDLIAWAEWYVWCLPFVGYGSGIDTVDLTAAGSVRGKGEHSNPVLTEVMAQIRAHQGWQIVLHRHICELPAQLRIILIMRYCGKRETIHFLSQGTQNIHHWSGPMPWSDLCPAIRLCEDTARKRLNQAKKLLETAMRNHRAVKAGLAGDTRRDITSLDQFKSSIRHSLKNPSKETISACVPQRTYCTAA